KIEAQDKIIKEQTEEIARLSHQLEDAYQKVSNIAIKSVEAPPISFSHRTNKTASGGKIKRGIRSFCKFVFIGYRI
ncbi:MAG: hypothetical protein AB1297_02835, partial [bacterium]